MFLNIETELLIEIWVALSVVRFVVRSIEISFKLKEWFDAQESRKRDSASND
jgi:hypothetical protein